MVRFKNRYITLAIDNGEDITQPLNLTNLDLYNAIIAIVNYVHGDVGCSSIKPGLIVKYCNELTKVGIIRVRHGPHKIVLSVLPLIRTIKNLSVSVKLIYVGATLLHCYRVLLKHQQVELDKVFPTQKTDQERNRLKPKLLTIKSLERFEDLSKKINLLN